MEKHRPHAGLNFQSGLDSAMACFSSRDGTMLYLTNQRHALVHKPASASVGLASVLCGPIEFDPCLVFGSPNSGLGRAMACVSSNTSDERRSHVGLLNLSFASSFGIPINPAVAALFLRIHKHIGGLYRARSTNDFAQVTEGKKRRNHKKEIVLVQ